VAVREAREMIVRQKERLMVHFGIVAVPIFIVVVWQASSSLFPYLFLPTPLKTFEVLISGLTERGWLLSDLKDTMIELILGYLLAVILGLAVGFILGINRFLREVSEPFVLNIYAIPKVTLFPIFLFLFGLGMESKIAFGFFHGIFPIVILTMGAIKDIKGIYIKVARSFRLNPLQLFKEVIFPSTLPSVMTGLRLGFNLAFIGVILGEMSASKTGLGYELMRSEGAFYMEKIICIVVVLAAIAIAVNYLYYFIEERFMGAQLRSF
jgi:NitT/TauT family transport system permease protein